MSDVPETTRYPQHSAADRALGDLLASSLHADTAWLRLYEGNLERARDETLRLAERALRALGALGAAIAEREGRD